MENWQKQYITENVSSLLQEIQCNSNLLDNLSKSGVLATGDVEKLNIQGNLNGHQEKTQTLLQILSTRRGAYEHLVKALYHCQQRGALITLLYGVQINISHQNPFRFCGIQPNPNDILSKSVHFQGNELPLKDICKPINPVCLNYIITDHVNVSLYKSFTDNELVTITTDTIPEALPYYISRSLSFKSQLDVTVFERRRDDIFLVEGIEFHELSRLARKFRHFDIDKSSNQIGHLTANIIQLEHPDHAQDIAKQTRKLVHRLMHQNRNYFYINSHNGQGVKIIKEFLKSTPNENISQDKLVEMCMKSKSRTPILLYGSSGTGKSILLAELARSIKDKDPSKTVLYFPFPEFLRKISLPAGEYDPNFVKQSILDLITTNKLGHHIMQELLDSKDHQIELFLDAFDEIHHNDIKAANALLDCIFKQYKNIRIFVATRPHRADELENKFGVLGYNILPFDDSNQTYFLLKYWENQLTVSITEEVKSFAESCLKTITSVMTADERDIVGIPLLCKILADVYGLDAKRGMISSEEENFRINSIYKMYKEYIKTELAIINDEHERKVMHNFHVQKAIQTIFPDIQVQAPSLDLEKIYMIGIMEPTKFDVSIPSFAHQTFAEFLVAEYIVTMMTENISFEVEVESLIELFFGSVLKMQTDLGQSKTGHLEPGYLIFSYPTVTHFINSAIMANRTLENNLTGFKTSFRQSSYYKGITFFNLLKASCRGNLVNLSKFLLDLFLDLEKMSDETGLKFQDCLQDTKSWERKDPLRFRLLLEMREINGIQNLICISVENSSVELVKIATEFVLAVTGKDLHEFTFLTDPISLAASAGHYFVFEYFLSSHNLNPNWVDILHVCLFESVVNTEEMIKDKLKILANIVKERPKIVNEVHPTKKCPPILSPRCHFQLIKFLIESGANVMAKDTWSQSTVVHLTATYFSTDEYHDFVELMISQNYSKMFKMYDKSNCTAVHVALKHLDLKTETLELLAKQCNIDFNDKKGTGGSELASAIRGQRSKRVLEDIVRLGGNWKSVGFGGKVFGNTALYLAIEEGNVEAVKYLLSLGADINQRSVYYLQSSLGAALLNESAEMVNLLVENGTNVNALFLPFENEGMFPFEKRFVSPLTYAKSKESLASTAAVLESTGAQPSTIKSFCCTTCLCLSCSSCWCCLNWFALSR